MDRALDQPGQPRGPAIIQGPSPTVSDFGQSLTLRAAVSGAGALKYQWNFNGAALAANARLTGLNTPTLTINPTQAGDSGLYSLSVTGPCANLSSPSVRVAVGPILSLLRTATSYRVSWTVANVTVEESTNVLGPWTPRLDLTGPFELPVQKIGQQFYRLRLPNQ